MTYSGALNNFWRSFGLKAYEENAVPTSDDKPDFPYFTYEEAKGEFDAAIPLTASLYTRSSSWIEANEKADEVYEFIGRGGVILPYDKGYILIQRASPFARHFGEESDNMIKRIIFNITAEPLTAR